MAVTIDTETFPPEVLQLRGRATISEVAEVDPDYALAPRRYLGDSQAGAYLNQINHPDTSMARIAVRPTWVGVVDFQSRMPSTLGGVQ